MTLIFWRDATASGRLRSMDSNSPASGPQPLTIAGFQKHIRDKYYATDAERGTPMTWMWFSEEVGELARALARRKDQTNIEEEFADVVAWLCTLANINGVDLAEAIRKKYLADGGPEGVK